MAFQRTTEWTCDVCLKKETVLSSDSKQGIDEPHAWAHREIHVSVDSKMHWARRVLMCDACLEGFKELYSFKMENKKELQKTFWQKLLGRK